jgi:pilus assembly protein Flp/PilA
MSIDKLAQLISGEDATTTVEYVVMLALIVIVCITAITTVGGETFNYWSNNRDRIDTALSSRP